MGHSTAVCAVSRLPIKEGEDCVGFIISPSKYQTKFSVLSLPIFGQYSGYMGLMNVVEDKPLELFLRYHGLKLIPRFHYREGTKLVDSHLFEQIETYDKKDESYQIMFINQDIYNTMSTTYFYGEDLKAKLYQINYHINKLRRKVESMLSSAKKLRPESIEEKWEHWILDAWSMFDLFPWTPLENKLILKTYGRSLLGSTELDDVYRATSLFFSNFKATESIVAQIRCHDQDGDMSTWQHVYKMIGWAAKRHDDYNQED